MSSEGPERLHVAAGDDPQIDLLRAAAFGGEDEVHGLSADTPGRGRIGEVSFEVDGARAARRAVDPDGALRRPRQETFGEIERNGMSANRARAERPEPFRLPGGEAVGEVDARKLAVHAE